MKCQTQICTKVRLKNKNLRHNGLVSLWLKHLSLLILESALTAKNSLLPSSHINFLEKKNKFSGTKIWQSI